MERAGGPRRSSGFSRAFRLEQMLVQLATPPRRGRGGGREGIRAGAPRRAREGGRARSSRGFAAEEEARFRGPHPPERSDFFRDAAGSAFARLAEEAARSRRGVTFDAARRPLRQVHRPRRERAASSSASASTSARRSRAAARSPGVRAAVERGRDGATSSVVGERRHRVRAGAAAVPEGADPLGDPLPRPRRPRALPGDAHRARHRRAGHQGDPGGRGRDRDELPDERPLRGRLRALPRLHRRRDEHGPARARAPGARRAAVPSGSAPPAPCSPAPSCASGSRSGEKREDILAGLHRAVILRAMSLLARSGGVADEFTFTGGVARNPRRGAGARRGSSPRTTASGRSTSRRTASTRGRSARRSSRCAGAGGRDRRPMRPPGSTSGSAARQGGRDARRRGGGPGRSSHAVAPRPPARRRRRGRGGVRGRAGRARRRRDELDYVATTGEGEDDRRSRPATSTA